MNQSVIVPNSKKGSLNDSIVIVGATNGTNKKDISGQRKSIQSIVNQAFEDGVVIANNESQLSNNNTL